MLCPLFDRVLCPLFDRVLCPLFDRVLCPLFDRVLCCVLCLTGCTARRSTQRVTMPLLQQSGNALTDRKCRALGQLVNSFVLVYVENLPARDDGSCVIQVPEIQVTCNTGSRTNGQCRVWFGFLSFPPPPHATS